MVKHLNVTAEITPERLPRIDLPPDIQIGKAEIEVVITTAPEEQKPIRTLQDLAKSEFIGIWKDRQDLGDTLDYARSLHEAAWTRND